MVHQPEGRRRSRRGGVSGVHDWRHRHDRSAPYGWADLVGYASASDEATQALPVLSPQLTRGQRWRADYAGETEPHDERR